MWREPGVEVTFACNCKAAYRNFEHDQTVLPIRSVSAHPTTLSRTSLLVLSDFHDLVSLLLYQQVDIHYLIPAWFLTPSAPSSGYSVHVLIIFSVSLWQT